MQIENIPVERIQSSPTNPRTNFDQVKLDELAESIKAKGVLQPILVRPISTDVLIQPPLNGINRWSLVGRNGRTLSTAETEEEAKLWLAEYAKSTAGRYELIAGERRWRASKLAGLNTVPAIVREIDDKEAIEIQVIENLQRSDLSPIEEAFGYQNLLEEHGYTADALAEKLSKSKSYIYGRLKLCNLPPEAIEAILQGDLATSIGELIGRLPSARMREELWREHYGDRRSGWFDWPSYREIKFVIEKHYMKELKGAPFSQTDKKLVEGAGSCKDCPKRTGNNRGDYPDGRADICTDPGCFSLKTRAAAEKEVAKLEKAGAQVLRGKEAEQALQYNSEYLHLDDECDEWREQQEERLEDAAQGEEIDYDSIGTRTYKELLRDGAGYVDEVIAVDDRTGKSYVLAKAEDVKRVIDELHGLTIHTPQEFHPSAGSDWAKQQAERRAEIERRKRVAEKVCEMAENAMASWSDETEFLLWRSVAKVLVRDSYGAFRDSRQRRGLEFDSFEAADKYLDSAPLADVMSLIGEVVARREMSDFTERHGDEIPETPFLAHLEIDLSQIYSGGK